MFGEVVELRPFDASASYHGVEGRLTSMLHAHEAHKRFGELGHERAFDTLPHPFDMFAKSRRRLILFVVVIVIIFFALFALRLVARRCTLVGGIFLRLVRSNAAVFCSIHVHSKKDGG